MNFLGVGVPELILIAVLALIFVGPKRLPEVMGQLGRAVGELRRQARDITSQFSEEFDELRQEYQEVRGEVTTMREELHAEGRAFKGDVDAAASDVRKATDVRDVIDTTARKPSSSPAPPALSRSAGVPARESTAEPAEQKVVRLQRRSSRRPGVDPRKQPKQSGS